MFFFNMNIYVHVISMYTWHNNRILLLQPNLKEGKCEELPVRLEHKLTAYHSYNI